MPPKKAPGPSKKTELKKKEKVIEDKTFGLKNKKGSKQQKFIQQVSKQVQSGGLHPKTDANKKKDEKEKKLQELKELASIFKPVQTQKVEKGTDPKSVVCAFFKQGICTKGDKCKFSHDLSIENKVEKRSIYVDMRDDTEDDMKNWDDAKLKEVVDKKHADEKKRPTTDIICKYFLEAVEKSKYGWFWECPNGGKCIYRHALPPGYVLKKDKKKMDDKPSEISLVDLIEKERAALGSNTTKVTLETFLAWKKRKILEKKEKLAAEEERKKNDFSKGKQFGISGREMFSFNPDLVDDGPMDDGDAAFEMYNRDEDDEEGVEYKELDFAALSMEAQEADGSGTVASESRLEEQASALAKIEEEEAAAAASAASEENDSNAPASDAAPINKDLFMGLTDELDDLDLEDEDDDDDDDDD